MTTASGTVALILSGGVGLGAYQAGAYAALQDHGALEPDWIAGSSIGGINAAVIAGNRNEDRVPRLHALWNYAERGSGQFAERTSADNPLRHAENWASALRTRLTGTVGHFRPRITLSFEPFKSIYDLSPLRARVNELVDFDLLNKGDMRFTLAAVDIESGDLVLFDTGRGERITVDHLLASCGYFPEFEPVQIAGRWLGDGGLAANAPIEALLQAAPQELTCFVLDLFPREGRRPERLETALSRKSDLLFSNQSWLRLEAFAREQRLHQKIAELTGAPTFGTSIYYLSHKPDPADAGSERPFDYSERTIARRWRAGHDDMVHALGMHSERSASGAVELVAVRRPSEA